MNYLKEQTDREAMINLIKNGDQPIPRVTQVSIAGTLSTEQPPLKDKSMWSDQEKKIQKIDHVDHAGCHLDRNSTSGSVQFLGDKLVYWSSKKQNFVSMSTAESKYVAVSSCCAQVLWMRIQLTDYGFFYDKVPIYYDSKSAIAISCNLVQHNRTKHIDVSAKSLAVPTQQLNSGNSFALTVAKCSSSGIFITSSGNALEHFIPNNPLLNLMLYLQ
nr:uncharacterized mitochondrial protein AtMg00810-like [Tanacetum cinerariifolium]